MVQNSPEGFTVIPWTFLLYIEPLISDGLSTSSAAWWNKPCIIEESVLRDFCERISKWIISSCAFHAMVPLCHAAQIHSESNKLRTTNLGVFAVYLTLGCLVVYVASVLRRLSTVTHGCPNAQCKRTLISVWNPICHSLIHDLIQVTHLVFVVYKAACLECNFKHLLKQSFVSDTSN